MKLTLPEINVQRLKDIAYSAAYLLVITLCFFIAIEAITIKTLNTSLLGALTVLLQLI